MILTMLLACAGHKQPPPAPEPVDEVAVVHRALSARDAAPSCEELEGMMSEPVATLTTIVQTIELPPQAPMRAATCLVDGHAEAASALIVGWMGAAETKGLALLVVQRLDDLPLSVAVQAAEAGLGGPVHDEVTSALQSSERPELRALLE